MMAASFTHHTSGIWRRVFCNACAVCLCWVVFCVLHVATGYAQDTYRVIWVHDGDTLRLSNNKNVRLAGLDTPETAKKGTQDQYYAREALAIAMKLAKNKEITLRTVSREEQDKFGRLVSEIVLPDGRSLNETLVAEGAGWVYWHNDLHSPFVDRLLQAQRTAIQEQKGMWKRLLQLPAAAASYVGNQKSRRFFPVASAEAQNISRRNIVHFNSLRAAFWEGFAPGRSRDPNNPTSAPRVTFLE